MKSLPPKNLFILFLTALIWGTAFVAQSVGMDHIGPFTFNAVRSYVGGIALIPVILFFNSRKSVEQRQTERANRKTLIFGGICCGIALGVVCFIKIWLIDRMLMGNDSITLMVDAVVCLTLAVTVVCAKLVGCSLPMIAKALKLDPAVMASPFITTIVDALSLVVYFLFAQALLGV